MGNFYSPEFVAKKLINIAHRNRYRQMRISGNEPTLNREHLIVLLNKIPYNYRFILETNGVLLGDDQSYCRELAKFPNLHVRVSLKGCNPEEFEYLTGIHESSFELQIKALENLVKEGVSCHPAVMGYFSTAQSLKQLKQRLRAIEVDFQLIEIEELMLYPAVEERLRRFNFIK